MEDSQTGIGNALPGVPNTATMKRLRHVIAEEVVKCLLSYSKLRSSKHKVA